MSDGTQSASSGSNVASAPATAPPATTGILAFWLVVIMLGILFVLVLALLAVVWANAGDESIVEYSKWAFSTLVGAFGAWIGAGAAYFFGKENLAESSRSTAEALRIQQEAMRGVPKPGRIRDLALTAMNKEFMFNPGSKKKDVIDGLAKYVDYWWVPVLDKDGKGTLEDVIHARVFLDSSFADGDSVSKILQDIDAVPALKAAHGGLHGSSFFVRVAPDDKIADATRSMDKSGAAVGVVVDEKGKPTCCFTKQNLATVQP